MIDVIPVIKNRIKENGVTLTFLHRRTGIDVDTISKCLLHKRKIKGDELIKLAIELGLEIKDFKDTA